MDFSYLRLFLKRLLFLAVFFIIMLAAIYLVSDNLNIVVTVGAGDLKGTSPITIGLLIDVFIIALYMYGLLMAVILGVSIVLDLFYMLSPVYHDVVESLSDKGVKGYLSLSKFVTQHSKDVYHAYEDMPDTVKLQKYLDSRFFVFVILAIFYLIAIKTHLFV